MVGITGRHFRECREALLHAEVIGGQAVVGDAGAVGIIAVVFPVEEVVYAVDLHGHAGRRRQHGDVLLCTEAGIADDAGTGDQEGENIVEAGVHELGVFLRAEHVLERQFVGRGEYVEFDDTGILRGGAVARLLRNDIEVFVAGRPVVGGREEGARIGYAGHTAGGQEQTLVKPQVGIVGGVESAIGGVRAVDIGNGGLGQGSGDGVDDRLRIGADRHGNEVGRLTGLLRTLPGSGEAVELHGTVGFDLHRQLSAGSHDRIAYAAAALVAEVAARDRADDRRAGARTVIKSDRIEGVVDVEVFQREIDTLHERIAGLDRKGIVFVRAVVAVGAAAIEHLAEAEVGDDIVVDDHDRIFFLDAQLEGALVVAAGGGIVGNTDKVRQPGVQSG